MDTKSILNAIHSKKLIDGNHASQPKEIKISLMEKSKKLVEKVIKLPEVGLFKAVGLKNLLNDTQTVSQDQKKRFER